MNDRILDARVARRIMGWKPHIVQERRSNTRADAANPMIPDVPWYTSDPAADYEVLKRVRATWSPALNVEFARQLERIWKDRFYAGMTLPLLSSWVCCYQPGDYSRAALRALDAEAQRPRRS